MVLDTRGNGVRTKQMVKESFGMLMVTFMKVNGKMIKRMVTAFIFTKMELDMKDFGKTIYKMVTELKPGVIIANMKAITKQE